MRVRSFLSIAVAVCLLGMVRVSSADDKEGKVPVDATVELESTSVAAGVGFSWGKGELHYKGKKYDLAVDGLTVGSVGASRSRRAEKSIT